MIPFLHSVAKAYVSRYSDLSEICFLFPNKRSGTFFLKYIKEELDKRAIMSPEVKTITEFVGDVSEKTVASRIDQLFTLYECYREYLGVPVEEDGDEENEVSFDSFLIWGETVLSDFNEVDQYLVNPEEIFKNVKDYREITSTFLTDEQKKVMAEYFGHHDFGDPGKFWKNFDDKNGLSEAKQKFLYLWRIMAPLYRLFHHKLEKKGLTTVGGSYRRALERLQEKGRSILPYKKIVAVGFNALSTAEHSIFAEIKNFESEESSDSFTDFFWDATGPVLTGDVNSASKFVKSNIKSFPCPEWALPFLRLSDSDELPTKLRVVASPSNSAQTKIAGKMLEELNKELPGKDFKNAKVAVVLPDENLLLPMLYSLPDGMGDVNLTMGYSMRLTSVVPFVTLLRKLLNSMRGGEDSQKFYYLDLKQFLGHPFTHILFTTDSVDKIVKYIESHHKINVSIKEIAEISPEAAKILGGMDSKFNPADAIKYLDSILELVADRLPSSKEVMMKARLEISHINTYRDALRRVQDLVAEYKVKMKARTVYRMIDRLLAGETVGFEGEPLTGLQVMGMLETRSIDFDHLFILSLNERILPRRARTRSFIPDSLRHAFGMPPSNYAEGIFAYYFYRMISRAKSVIMIYDARTGGLKSGDVSRYVLQLRYLFAKENLKEEDWKFILSGRDRKDPSVVKTPEIMGLLEKFCQEGGKNLSASALEAYRKCQVKFFYQWVLEMNADPAPSEFIDAISAGNILHDVMLNVYLPKDKQKKILNPPIIITPDNIDDILSDESKIKSLVRKSVNRIHFKLKGEEEDNPLTGTAEMVGEQIMEQVKKVLKHDLELAPFKIHGLEITDNFKIKLPDREVNFRFAIDRLDEINYEGRERLRIVDYKTGTLKLEAQSFEDLFHGDYKGEQVFQLFTYAWLLGKMTSGIYTEDVMLEIYDVPGIHKGEINLPSIGTKEDVEETSTKKSGNFKKDTLKIVESYKDYSNDFSKGMEGMVEDIFTAPEFTACEEDRCKSCAFRAICHR